MMYVYAIVLFFVAALLGFFALAMVQDHDMPVSNRRASLFVIGCGFMAVAVIVAFIAGAIL